MREIFFYRTELNGKEGNLITKWQIDRGKTKPRLISNWLKVPQASGDDK